MFLDDLVAYWNLDEASGNRADSVGSLTLTDNNSVGSGTGKVGNAADLERDNSQYLSVADAPAVSTGDVDFTIALWFKRESTVDHVLLSKWNGSTNDREYMLELDSDVLFWSVSGNGTGTGAGVLATSNGAISNGTWYFIVVWHDATANTLNIKVNDGTTDTTSYSGGIRDGAADFGIGARLDASPSGFADGLFDEVGIWKRVLSGAEITALYNSGTGMTYPFGETPPSPSTQQDAIMMGHAM